MTMSKAKTQSKGAATEKTDAKAPDAAAKKKQLAGKGDFAEQEKNLKPDQAGAKQKGSFGGGETGGAGGGINW